jgi:hypothetical protein
MITARSLARQRVREAADVGRSRGEWSKDEIPPARPDPRSACRRHDALPPLPAATRVVVDDTIMLLCPARARSPEPAGHLSRSIGRRGRSARGTRRAGGDKWSSIVPLPRYPPPSASPHCVRTPAQCVHALASSRDMICWALARGRRAVGRGGRNACASVGFDQNGQAALHVAAARHRAP